ncbi:MAG: TerB family tellurite resistance protein [Hyphomonadaceae bacterium]
MTASAQSVPCPRCNRRPLTTVATAPYARGFLLAYQTGNKKIAGCTSCVGQGLRAEAGKSLLFGWFSITALVLNLFFIPWNFFRSFFVSPDARAVTKLFDQIGVPEPGKEYRLTEAFYAAGAALIRADGKVDAGEIEAAVTLGQRMLPEFVESDFLAVLKGEVAQSPIETIGNVLRIYLNPEGQRMVLVYLLAIANADGEMHKSEDKYLERLSRCMGWEKKQYRELRDGALAPAPAAQAAAG